MNNSFEFPSILAINEQYDKNVIQQVLLPSYVNTVVIEPYVDKSTKGYTITPIDKNSDPIFVTTKKTKIPGNFDKAIWIKSADMLTSSNISIKLSHARWLRHPLLDKIPLKPIDYKNITSQVLKSWHNSFKYLEENSKKNIKGLRPPQIGAVHAVHAHWAISKQAATIVMPTGTGKTETMLSVYISQQCQKLLVVVPTDTLRTQIGNKFLTLGILKDIDVLAKSANYPVVGILKHKPRNLKSVDSIFEKCNVIVTTMNIAGQCLEKIQERFSYHCPYLFVDEAHHIAATTWKQFKDRFMSQRILQFTATPFRNDDKPIDGEIIFNYPLKKAQEEGYFTHINFSPIEEYDHSKSDLMIAKNAITQLRKDTKRNHIVMARTANIKRAMEVFNYYKGYKEFNPVQLHTGIKSSKEREKIRQMILKGDSKIVVCVDMLGEGFDLPELKIAAFHDIKKSLPVTLQLAVDLLVLNPI